MYNDTTHLMLTRLRALERRSLARADHDGVLRTRPGVQRRRVRRARIVSQAFRFSLMSRHSTAL